MILVGDSVKIQRQIGEEVETVERLRGRFPVDWFDLGRKEERKSAVLRAGNKTIRIGWLALFFPFGASFNLCRRGKINMIRQRGKRRGLLNATYIPFAIGG